MKQPRLVLLACAAACTPSPSSSTRATAAAVSVTPATPDPSGSAEPSSCVLPPRAEAKAETRGPANLAGAPLTTCSTAPMTGVYRDGRCATGPDDVGVHVVCAEVTEPFLRFTASRGNDLSTPARGFPGLKPDDRWCLCASRWAEAEAAGVAPPVVLDATEAAALRTIDRQKLEAHATVR